MVVGDEEIPEIGIQSHPSSEHGVDLHRTIGNDAVRGLNVGVFDIRHQLNKIRP